MLETPPRNVPTTPFWSVHTHSRYSVNDAMSHIPDLVERGVELGYPALGLTDHGWMPGVVQLYKEGKKHGLPVAPGVEMYLTSLHDYNERRSMHLTTVSYTTKGYRNLVALHNQAQAQFHYRPRLDMADLAAAAEAGMTSGIAIGTGCRSGPVVRALTERGEEAATQVVKALAGWFPRVYVELMDHHFAADGMHDSEITEALFGIANSLGLPVIITSDTHYTRREEQDLHNALKTIVSWSDDPADGRFSGSGYFLPTWDDLLHYPQAVLDAGAEGLADLARALKVKIPELDTFTAKIPDVTLKGEALAQFSARVQRELEAYCDANPKEAKQARARVAAELPVIGDSGMAEYLMLVQAGVDYMEEHGIWFHVRGSAAGSLCLFLTGVTQYNPLPQHWDILMERFLSGDRTSLPDIDIDIEHTRREEVIRFYETTFGYELRQVCTRPEYGLDPVDEDGDSRGSLRVRYFATLRKTAGKPVSWVDVPDEDKKTLYTLSDRKLISGFGAHPAGMVIAADAPTVGVLPMVMIGSSKKMVTAFDKDELEELGYPKVDFLGSKALTAIKICCELIAGVDSDPWMSPLELTKKAKAWYRAIPMDDKAAVKRAGSGRTIGLFQLGGATNRRFLEEMRPAKTADIVAAQALARPAPLNSKFTERYMKRRRKAEPVTQLHDDIMRNTKDTYGLAIYQEQVVGILRDLGVQSDQLTRLLKAVKASGKHGEAKARQIVGEEIESVRERAFARGWEQADIDYLARCLIDYGAGYSFGKGHSVTYGCVGYNTSYLAEHEPLAYWTGVLNAYQGSKNTKGEPLEPMYVRAARNDDIRVVDAHVNLSGTGYIAVPEKGMIRRGLASIKDVGVVAAREIVKHQPYESLVQFGQKVSTKVSGKADLVYGKDPLDCTGAVYALGRAKAFAGVPVGTPVVVLTGRGRKCPICVVTFAKPAELTQHFLDRHPEVETAPREDA